MICPFCENSSATIAALQAALQELVAAFDDDIAETERTPVDIDKLSAANMRIEAAWQQARALIQPKGETNGE